VQNKAKGGAYYYLDVFLARDVARVTYRLSVTTRR
jgi:hypothetical protein